MRCIYCQTPLAGISYCPGCGADVTLQKRIGRISNLLYNQGLEKATVRDLSGAISCLKQSLKFNKENIDARNLLGLCYYETGEVVSALCEWVISKNMFQENNPAEYYLDQLQKSRNQLDVINQSIRKYNQSIEYCRQGNEDMAIMQLRKVIASNPKLVKAYQLLALLYIKEEQPDKAKRVLKKALAIDNTNTMTLRYLSEVEGSSVKHGFGFKKTKQADQEKESGETLAKSVRYIDGSQAVIMPTTFRDSSTLATFINIGLGLLLGGAIVWFLAIPASRQAINDKANKQVTDANLALASVTAQLDDLQDEIDSYKSQVDSANEKVSAAEAKAGSYDSLLSAAQLFVSGQTSAAVDAVDAINGEDLSGAGAELYSSLTAAVGDAMFLSYYTQGTTAYVNQNYSEAATQLKKAVDADPNGAQTYYYDALYYLGFAYYNMGDTTNADNVFNTLMQKYPNQASQVSPYLSGSSSSGQTAQEDNAGAQTAQADNTGGDTSGDGSGAESTQDVVIY